MRLLVLLTGGLGLVVAPVLAQPDSLARHFEAAGEAYAQDRYEEAVGHYRRILDAGVESGALYHNLGNAYVRLDRVGPAIWAYENGRRLRPADPRLRHNLEYVRRREGLPLSGLPPRGLAALVAGWSPLFLFGIGWLLLCGGLIAAVFRAGPDRLFAWRGPGSWGPVGAGLLLVAVALGTSSVQGQSTRAVVVAEQVPVRGAPEDAAAPDTTLQEGSMLEVEVRREPWVRVRLGNGTVGWVLVRAVREV